MAIALLWPVCHQDAVGQVTQPLNVQRAERQRLVPMLPPRGLPFSWLLVRGHDVFVAARAKSASRGCWERVCVALSVSCQRGQVLLQLG